MSEKINKFLKKDPKSTKNILSIKFQTVLAITSVVITILFVASSIQLAFAEEIPHFIKNKINLFANNQTNGSDFLQIVLEMTDLGILELQKDDNHVYFLPSYGGTTFVEINGKTQNYRQSSPVLLIITKPDDSKLRLTTPVLDSGTFSTIMILDHGSPLGAYKVIAYQNGKEVQLLNFYVVKSDTIPSWIRNVSKLWVEDMITEKEFVNGLQYLINNRIINLDNNTYHSDNSILNVSVDGQKTVRRGTTQSITAHVTNTRGPVNGATIFVRIEDYGENVLKEFKGNIDPSGNYNVKWEINEDDFNDIKTLRVYVDVTDGVSSTTKVFTFQVYCLCGELNCKCHR